MSTRLEVLKAIKLGIAVALPLAEVLGLDGEEAPPSRVQTRGRVIVRTGDPGEPEVDLSPLAYNWLHRIPIEVVAVESVDKTAEENLDAMLVAIDAFVTGDRHLGGRCDWLDAEAPATEDIFAEGASPPRGADLIITAAYVTSSPLS